MKIRNINFGVLRSFKKLADDYGPELLCGGAIISLGLAIYGAFKASEEVVEIKNDFPADEIKVDKEASPEAKKAAKERRITRDIHYALAYKWVLMFGTGSIVMMVASNRISGSKIAGLTVALAASEDKLKKLGQKVKEHVGEEKFQEIRDDFRKDILDEKIKNGESAHERVEIRTGDTPDGYDTYFDTFMHTLIEVPESQVLDAITKAQDYMHNGAPLQYNKWREFLGLNPCPAGRNYEWNSLTPFEARIGSMSADGTSIKTIEYTYMPDVHRR